MRKGPVEAERDTSQHAVGGGIARLFFFRFRFIYQFTFFFLLLCLDQWTQHDQTNKAKRCRGRKQLQHRRQTRSKSYGTWGQQMKTPRKNNKQNKNQSKDITQYNPGIFFLSGNAPGGTFCPIFVLKNAPGTLQTPRGHYFGIVLWNTQGGVYSVLYCTRYILLERYLNISSVRVTYEF